MTKTELILNYIHQYQASGPQVIDCFSNGMCYQFSMLLHIRFKDCGARKVYDAIINHFAVEIDGRIYDITGDIADDPQYRWQYFDLLRFEDPLHYEHLRRDCIWKVPSDVVICEFCKHSWSNDDCVLLCDLNRCPTDPNHTCEKGENK